MIDLAQELITALQSPAVREVLINVLRPLVAEAMSEAAADRLLGYKEAAAFLGMSYGSFKTTVNRDRSLHDLALGRGKGKRFKKTDLEYWQMNRKSVRRALDDRGRTAPAPG